MMKSRPSINTKISKKVRLLDKYLLKQFCFNFAKIHWKKHSNQKNIKMNYLASGSEINCLTSRCNNIGEMGLTCVVKPWCSVSLVNCSQYCHFCSLRPALSFFALFWFFCNSVRKYQDGYLLTSFRQIISRNTYFWIHPNNNHEFWRDKWSRYIQDLALHNLKLGPK